MGKALKSSPIVMPTDPRECSGFQLASAAGPGHPALLSLQAAWAWPTFRLLRALLAEHLGSAWGKSCEGFIRLISPQRQMGSFTGAWEVESIHRHANVSGGHVQGCFWECQLCYPAAGVFVHHLAVCDPRWCSQQAKRIRNTQIFFCPVLFFSQ